MFQINRLKLSIKAIDKDYLDEENNLSNFGFDISFQKGLNIINGENTVGKSTIIACIYYALGLEDLLGAGTSGLDKALHAEFIINGTKYDQINISTIFIEVQNSKEEIYTLKRYIKSNDENTIRITNGKLDDVLHKTALYLFVKSKNKDTNMLFHLWFSNFVGLQLPLVSSYTPEREEVTLPIKAIFLATFINQINGWSNFLGMFDDINQKFNVKDIKARVIEYILDLANLSNELEKDRIETERKQIKKEWAKVCNKLNILSDIYLAQELPEKYNGEPIEDETIISELSFHVRKDISQTQYIPLGDYINELQDDIKNMILTPKLATTANNSELRENLNMKLNEIHKYRREYDVFLADFEGEKNQLIEYNYHLKDLLQEININKDVSALKKQHSIDLSKNCPTCGQLIRIDELNEHIDIETKAINGNIEYLENQKELLESSKKNLEYVISHKKELQKHFIRDIAQLENEVKYIQSELCDPILMPSRSQLYQQIILEGKVRELTKVSESFIELKGELLNLAQRFNNLNIELEGVQELIEGDLIILKNLNKDIRQLLQIFGYTSNSQSQIDISLKGTNKYFPYIKLPNKSQKIQTSSSASDFIRSIWAYTIALLMNSKTHPGILLIDEPSQHAMNSESLRAFFKELSKFKDKQIIVAASTEVKDPKNIEGKKQYSLDEVLEGIEYHSIIIESKAIRYMNN